MTKLRGHAFVALVLLLLAASFRWSPMRLLHVSSRSLAPADATTGRELLTIHRGNHELQGKIVVFLDIDGVIAPYGLDPMDDDADDDASHFFYDDQDSNLAKLQSHNCWRDFTNETMDAFSKILSAFPHSELRVILSSYWRIHNVCRGAILQKFRDYGSLHGGPLRQFDYFDDRTGDEMESRQAEIAQWLLKFNPDNDVLAAWVVLDDSECLRGRENKQYRDMFVGRVVKPFEDVGLTDKDADKAIQILNEQLGAS
ncbi:expressed unknown protein [Seminavis robusta]|uniref:Uncharacterized protein n=1 Tax=Seminavis robusta TaxID=568900 RepID=A0A9N8EW30_9STRA|nr:expressed unknown protein [Seminavis robusta]|eukprot:Sro2078_g313640.1 n/a (256) ;mRNA; f:4102-4869